ncbi:unnamed protein product, partial [Pocillopora meandrina]
VRVGGTIARFCQTTRSLITCVLAHPKDNTVTIRLFHPSPTTVTPYKKTSLGTFSELEESCNYLKPAAPSPKTKPKMSSKFDFDSLDL